MHAGPRPGAQAGPQRRQPGASVLSVAGNGAEVSARWRLRAAALTGQAYWRAPGGRAPGRQWGVCRKALAESLDMKVVPGMAAPRSTSRVGVARTKAEAPLHARSVTPFVSATIRHGKYPHPPGTAKGVPFQWPQKEAQYLAYLQAVPGKSNRIAAQKRARYKLAVALSMLSTLLQALGAAMRSAGLFGNGEKQGIARMLLLAAAALTLVLQLVPRLRHDPAGTSLLLEPCDHGSLRGSLGCLEAISDSPFPRNPRHGVGQDELWVGPRYAGYTEGSPGKSLHKLVTEPRKGEAQDVKGRGEGHSDAAALNENRGPEQGHGQRQRQGPARPSDSDTITASGSALTQQKGNASTRESGTAPMGGAGEHRKGSSSGSSRPHNNKGIQRRHSPGTSQSNAHVADQSKPETIRRSEDLLTSASSGQKEDGTRGAELPRAVQATGASGWQAGAEGSRRREDQRRETLALPGHEGDAPKVRELAAIMQQIARNNTVVVIPTNAGYLDMALNVRCRLLHLNATNFMIWALDKEAAAKLQHREIRNFYYDPTLFSVKNETGYYDADYIRMMSERPKVWWRMLATGFDIMFLDADVVVFDPPEQIFARRGDMEGQVDGWGWAFERNFTNVPALCAGAFWVRSSAASLDFMDSVIHSFDGRLMKEDRWDDQIALNWILHNKSHAVIANRGSGGEGDPSSTSQGVKPLVMYFSNPTKILPGHLWWGTQVVGYGYKATISVQVDPKEPTLSFRPSLFHLSGHGAKWKKVNTLQEFGWWMLNGDLQCRASRVHVN